MRRRRRRRQSAGPRAGERPQRELEPARAGEVENGAFKNIGLFLTGNPEDLETLRQNLGFAWSDPVLDADLANHIGTVKMGNVPRGWWGASPSLTDPRQIARVLVWMAPEPGQSGTIGHLPGEEQSLP